MGWLWRGLIVFVALIVVALGGGYLWLRGSLPSLSGEVAVAGLEGPVEIVRDRHAVPHIYAASSADAAFGLGYVHAQDRLWQMEMSRRIGAGRLSEVVGAAGLGVDRFLRTLSVYHFAEAAVAGLDITTQAQLEAYAAGVNAFLETRSGPLPPEFLILGHTPEPWRPADSLVWAKMMAWDLGANWRGELLRSRLATKGKLTARQISELYPPYPGQAPVALPDLAALYRKLPLERLWAALPPGPERANGSNNWVVAGSRTQSGKPLLANDPHLGLTAPSVWYFAHLEAPGLKVIGATLPGIPAVVLGRNAHIAWGFTNTGPDVQDLFIEKLDPRNANAYLTPDGPRPFEVRREVIKVKDAEPVMLEVRLTRHGPVISDVSKQAAEIASGPFVLAMAWTALEPNDTTAQALMGMNRAQNWPEFVAALRHFQVPQQNIVYADTDGNIGYYAPARVPLRSPQNEVGGMMPVPGWQAKYDWQGFVPFEELPQAFNPARGHVATANHKIVPPGYRHFITREWAPPYRARRIEDLLAAGGKHSIASFRRLQMDETSLMARDFLVLMRPALAQAKVAEAVKTMMASWDGAMARDRPEPLLFSAWYRELTRLVMADELGTLFKDYWGQRPLFMNNVLSTQRHWCDNVATTPREGCSELIASALEQAVAVLAEDFGDDPTAWRWGQAHQAHSEHRPFSKQPFLGDLFDIRLANSGGSYAVNAARFRINNAQAPYDNYHGPSLRAIYDLSQPDRSLYIHTSGQSGNLLSPHYADFAAPWRDGEFIAMTMQRREIESGALGTLVLAPK